MNLSKRQKIKHGNGLMDTKIASNRYLKQINLLSCESDTLRSFEYILRPSMYTDTIPVHIGCWILAFYWINGYKHPNKFSSRANGGHVWLTTDYASEYDGTMSCEEDCVME